MCENAPEVVHVGTQHAQAPYPRRSPALEHRAAFGIGGDAPAVLFGGVVAHPQVGGKAVARIPLLGVHARRNRLFREVFAPPVHRQELAERQRKVACVGNDEHVLSRHVGRYAGQCAAKRASPVCIDAPVASVTFAAFARIGRIPRGGEVECGYFRRRVTAAFLFGQPDGQIMIQKPIAFRAADGAFLVHEVVRRTGHESAGAEQVDPEVLHKPLLRLRGKPLQDGLGRSSVGENRIGMASACVEQVAPREIQLAQKLVHAVLQKHLQVERPRTELLQCARPADLVDEVLDAAQVARPQQKHRIIVMPR